MNEAKQLFSGTPIPQDQPCGWMERHDALHQDDSKPTPGPWNWEIHDQSMATLCGGGEDAIIGHVMAVSPCRACADRADKWEWGRCQTPRIANARLIAAAPDLLAALHVFVNAVGNHPVTSVDEAEKIALAAITKATAP